MSRSSGETGRTAVLGRGDRRAQTEPLAALAAVSAVLIGLGIYAGMLDAALATPGEERLGETVLDTTADRASDATGVLTPSHLPHESDVAPAGHRLNATLTTAGRRWGIGPPRPDGAADDASCRVAVRLAPNRTAVGRLRVVVW